MDWMELVYVVVDLVICWVGVMMVVEVFVVGLLVIYVLLLIGNGE